jgi:Tol biopolymer transport system component
MQTLIRTTKTKTYINFGGELFYTNNDWTNKEILAVDLSKLQPEQKTALNSKFGWDDIGEHETLQNAYFAFIGLEIIKKNERKAQTEILKNKFEAIRKAEWDAIKDLAVIPSTIENIRTVLLQLNSSNWGSWDLPKMSISYSAAQYDCEGVQATTMKLDKAVDGTNMYKVGGKRGHLSKYTTL